MLDREPVIGSDQFDIHATRRGTALVITIELQRICKTRTAQQVSVEETIERRPSVPVVVIELAVAALGAATFVVGYQERGGDPSHDLGYLMYYGLPMFVGGTVAGVVDIASAETKRSSSVVRSRPSIKSAPCPRKTLTGRMARVVGGGIQQSGRLDVQGRVQLELPESFSERGTTSLDVFVSGQFVGSVVVPEDSI